MKDPRALKNNHNQAIRMAAGLEKTLRARDSNKVLMEFIDRDCFMEI